MPSQPKKNQRNSTEEESQLTGRRQISELCTSVPGELLENQGLPGTNPTDGQIQLREHGISHVKKYKKRKLDRDIQQLIWTILAKRLTLQRLEADYSIPGYPIIGKGD